jgi:TonB family protein
MKRLRVETLVLALALPAAAVPAARAQNSPAAPVGAPHRDQAPDAENLTVELVNRIPPVDKGNLQSYWADVESQIRRQWIQVLPAAARPPASTPGTVKYLAWIHTDGRVTGLALEQPSGNAALDRAAQAAIKGSVPLEAFPYGISVRQVKARFTFIYNGGGLPGVDRGPLGAQKKPRG